MTEIKKKHKEFWYTPKEEKESTNKEKKPKLSKDNPLSSFGEYTFGNLWGKDGKKKKSRA